MRNIYIIAMLMYSFRKDSVMYLDLIRTL